MRRNQPGQFGSGVSEKAPSANTTKYNPYGTAPINYSNSNNNNFPSEEAAAKFFMKEAVLALSTPTQFASANKNTGGLPVAKLQSTGSSSYHDTTDLSGGGTTNFRTINYHVGGEEEEDLANRYKDNNLAEVMYLNLLGEAEEGNSKHPKLQARFDKEKKKEKIVKRERVFSPEEYAKIDQEVKPPITVTLKFHDVHRKGVTLELPSHATISWVRMHLLDKDRDGGAIVNHVERLLVNGEEMHLGQQLSDFLAPGQDTLVITVLTRSLQALQRGIPAQIPNRLETTSYASNSTEGDIGYSANPSANSSRLHSQNASAYGVNNNNKVPYIPLAHVPASKFLEDKRNFGEQDSEATVLGAPRNSVRTPSVVASVPSTPHWHTNGIPTPPTGAQTPLISGGGLFSQTGNTKKLTQKEEEEMAQLFVNNIGAFLKSGRK